MLSCADSRVPLEVVFHTGLGDLFVVRAAGTSLGPNLDFMLQAIKPAVTPRLPFNRLERIC